MAQSVITGTVLSIEDETPVVGASVKVQGTNDGAVTDMYGRFSLKNVKSGTKLVISYIGMKSRTVMARQNMRVILENDSKALDEVLVQVAYGAAKKSTLTGAVSQVDSKQIEVRPVSSVTSALEGSTSGVQITVHTVSQVQRLQSVFVDLAPSTVLQVLSMCSTVYLSVETFPILTQVILRVSQC